MDSEAAVTALTHLGITDADDSVSRVPDGGSTLLRSNAGSTATLLRRKEKYDILVVGAQPDCPVPALRAVLETAVLPLSDDYAARIGVALPERDALRKRIREASVALDVIAKGRLFSVTAPKIPVHEELHQHVEAGAASVDDLPDNFADDLSVLNQLQANVIVWSKEVDRLVQNSREGPGSVLSAEEETVFWSSLEAALSAAQQSLSSRTVKLSLDILARKRRATGFLIDANNSLDTSRRKAAGVLTFIQGLPIVALRTAEDLLSLRKGVVRLLEHIAAKLRISSFSVERMLSLLDSMGGDVNRSIGRILQEKGDLLRLPFDSFVAVFETCCDLFESWSQGFDHCRKVARDAARKKNEAIPPRRRSPLSSLYNHLTDVYEVRSDHEAIREAIVQFSRFGSQLKRLERVDSAFSALVSDCDTLNHFDFSQDDKARWGKARLVHKSEMAEVEGFLAREYASTVRQGRDMRSLAIALQPFGVTLEKHFMAGATAKAVGDVLDIGMTDLKVLKERENILDKSREVATDRTPAICITLSECQLLKSRAFALKQQMEKVLGKMQMQVSSEVKEFISEIDRLRERVNPYERFKKWLDSVDIDVRTRPILRLEDPDQGNATLSVSMQSSAISFPRVIRMAKENHELASLLSSRHHDFSRFAKTIVRTYSILQEALTSFNMISQLISELNDITHLRIYNLLESLIDAARDILEEGFTVSWGSPSRKLQDYAFRLMNICGQLWSTSHTLLQSDTAFQTSQTDLMSLYPIVDRKGMLNEETRLRTSKILKRMEMARTSLLDLFSETEVEQYISMNWGPLIHSSLLAFAGKQTEAWFEALEGGHLEFERVVFDAAPNMEGRLQISLNPCIADVELSLIHSLGNTYESFAECFSKLGEVIPTRKETNSLSCLLSSHAHQKSGQKITSSSDALGHVAKAICRILRTAREWSQYVPILQNDLRCDPGPDVSQLRECKEKLEEFTTLYEDITTLREKDESFNEPGQGRILYDSRVLSAKLLAKIRADLLLNGDRIASTASDASQKLYNKISETKSLLTSLSGTDFAETMITLQTIKEEVIPSCTATLNVLAALEDKFDRIAERTGDESFACAQSAEAWILSESLHAHFRDFSDAYERRRATILANHATLTEKYRNREELFRTKLTTLFEDFQNIRNNSSEEETFIDTDSLMQDLEHQLNSLICEGHNLERLTRALNLPHRPDVTGPRDILQELKRVREGYADLALIEESILKTSEATLLNVDPAAVRDQLSDLLDKVENISNSSGAKTAARKLQKRISKCLKGLSLFGALKSVRLSPAREREVLKKLLAKDHSPMESMKDLPLALFWDRNAHEHEAYIRQVLENAAGEASICDFIASIERTWTRRKCTLLLHDGVPVVQGIPNLFDELDEHLQALETMSSSQHAKLFESERYSWEQRLGKCRQQLEVLADVQARWVHINTLFGSQPGSGVQGLRKELQEEFSAFASVHARFSGAGNRLRSAPGLLEGMESSLGLEDMGRELQGIVRGLSKFLERQRSRFPRFFFLPDDDLLQVLSITPSTLSALLPHIGKLFPGVQRLEYELVNSRASVSSVVSREGEMVSFSNPIRISEGEEVSNWLHKIQEGLVRSLREAMASALTELREEYITSSGEGISTFVQAYVKYPAQISLTVIRQCFTDAVETCLSSESSVDVELRHVFQRIELLLQSTCSLSHDHLSSRDSSHRFLMLKSQLIKELVYQRDLVKSLIDRNVTNKLSPKWDHNIRVYCESGPENTKLKILLRCGLSEFEYGWEYLGVGETLVHTELTSRCFLTLGEALRRGYGGSPFGPAGTGKTETVKALGRTLGRFVAVFNCDESFDSVSVGRILAGVCRIGCWVCFDEFNRLSTGILSSTSGQLASLQVCIRKGRNQIQNFYGGDLPIVVRPGVGVFVTMNPTYSGRSELPANLKTLFRPCAMSKPESVAIAEVLLLTCGFKFASSLSRKMVSFFESLQATVSHQPHYDFGLRSLKTTILASSNLVQGELADVSRTDASNQAMEEEILIRGIEEVVKPKLSPSDTLEYDVAIRSTFTEASCLSPELPNEVKSILTEVMTQRNLTPTKGFMEKLRQLYWLMKHQFGVMLVGATGTGKSAVWRTLYDTVKRLLRNNVCTNRKGFPSGSRSTLITIDPKLLSASQLYGSLDPITREWTDGLFTKTLRRIFEEQNEEEHLNSKPLHWIVFDGDVDPVWAENLNSVLDDNRILTLPSGEQIPLLNNTRILFEADNLDHANPSTVSRCGMICFGEERLPRESLKMSLDRIYEDACNSTSKNACLSGFADLLVSTAGNAVESGNLVMTVPLQSILRSTSTLLQSCLNRLRNIKSEENRDEQGEVSSSLSDPGRISYLSEAVFFRALLVSSVKALCAGLHHSSRPVLTHAFVEEAMTFDDIRNAFAGIAVPSDLSDVTVIASGELRTYHDLVPNLDTPAHQVDLGNPDVVIPTPTTVRLKSFLQDAVKLTGETSTSVRPLLLCGPPGCGKSLLLTAALKEVPNVSLCAMSFSSETSHEDVLAALKGYMEISKRPNGCYVLRPKSSGYRVVLFCDEVNLEKPDAYGSQRSVSVLRSIAEYGGYWDGVLGHWVTIEGIYIVAACNPEEDAGRNKLSHRFLSHCSVVRVEQPNSSDLHIIYGFFVKSLLTRVHESLYTKADRVTFAMVDFFTRNKNRFCPDDHGPLLSHYIYSPRELSRWVRGLKQLLIDSNRDDVETGTALTVEVSPDELWREVVLALCYEARRLFIDRLPTSDERTFAENALAAVAKQHLKVDKSLLLDVLYTSWQEFDSKTGGSYPRFRVVRSPEQFRKLIYRKLRVFAEEEGLGGSWLTSGGSSNFDDSSAMIDQFAVTDEVLTHLTRIERILCSSLGHAVLMGAPGTGKKTLARFAAWMLNMDVCQVHSHTSYSEEDFAQDLRQILQKAGVRGRKIALLFDESHAMESGFLEIMNSLLACGDVPGLFSTEERVSLLEEMRAANITSTASAATEHTLYAEFISRVRDNLHIVFTISSLASSKAKGPSTFLNSGIEDISKRSPALYNRCTVDWIGDWTRESLEAVAELKLEVSLGQEKDQIIRCAVKLHNLTRERFRLQGRRVIVTPRHFLEFVEQLNRIALEKGGEIQAGVERHTEGLRRLRHAGSVVDELKDSLEEKSLRLQRKEANANEMLKRMVEEQRLAEKSKVDAEQLALAAAEAASAVKAREEEVAEQLAAVQPKVEAARQAVGSIRKEFLEELRGMPHPPSGARIALEGVMMVLDASNKKSDCQYSWASIRSRMRGSDFIASVVNFDAKDVPRDLRKRIEKKILNNPDYDVQKISFASRAAGPLAEWTLAVLDFAAVVEAVEPLQAEVCELHDEQEELQRQQMQASEEVKKFEIAIEQCKTDYAVLVSEAEKVRQEIKESETNLRRAEEMLDSLASEWDRWINDLNDFNTAAVSVWGNAVLGAAFLAYAGELDHKNRSSIRKEWKRVLHRENIPFDEDLEISTFLTSAHERGFWSSRGLPTDSTSLENYAILKRSARFPLIVDPTRQNAKLIRHILDDSSLITGEECAAASSELQIAETSFNVTEKKSYMRALESAMRFGTSLVLDDADNFDRAVLPLLGQESSYGDATKFAESLSTPHGKRKDSSQGSNICQRVVRLGERDVFLSPNFRMYMSTVSLNFVPMAAITRSNVVSFELSPDALGMSCVSTALAILSPEIELKRKDYLISTLHNQERKHRLEEEVLETVNNIEDLGTELLRGSLLDNLSSLKKEVRMLLDRQKEEEEASAAIRKSESLFEPLGRMAIDIYSILQKLRNFDPLYEFDTAFFMKTFERSISEYQLSSARSEESDQVERCQSVLLKHTYAEIACRLFPRDRLPFAAAMSLATLPHMRLENSVGNAEMLLETILKAWGRFVSDKHAKSISDEKRRSSVTDLLPSHMRERLMVVNESVNPPHKPEQVDLALQVLRASLCEPHFVSKAIDGLACTLPGKDELVHSHKSSPEFALRKEVAEYADSAKVGDVERGQFAPILLCSKGNDSDPSAVVTEEAAELRLSLISMSMGSTSTDDSISEAVALANERSERGEKVVVVLKNMHLASKVAKEKLTAELTKRHGRLSFLMIVAVEITSDLSISLMLGGLTFFNVLAFEALPSFRSNFSRALGLLSSFRDDGKDTAPEQTDVLSRLQVLLSWLHACLLERAAHSPVGFKKAYEFSDGDLSAAWDVLGQGAKNLHKSDACVENLIHFLTHAVYGSRVEHEVDNEVLRALVSEAFGSRQLQDTTAHHIEVFTGSVAGSSTLVPLDEKQRSQFIRNMQLEADPGWVHMSPLAPHRKYAREGLEAMEKILCLVQERFRQSNCQNNEAEREHPMTTREFILQEGVKLPSVPELTVDQKNSDPIQRFWATESSSVRVIVDSIREHISIMTGDTSATLQRSKKVLRLREELDASCGHEEAEIPNTWKTISLFHGKAQSLAEFFSRIRMTIACLRTHVLSNERLPVNFSGISRPKALLTALRSREAARLGVAPHHLTATIRGEDDCSLRSTLVSGIFAWGACWDRRDKRFHLSDRENPSASYYLSWCSQEDTNNAAGTTMFPIPLYCTRVGDFLFMINVPAQKQTSLQQWRLRGVSLSLFR